MTKQAIIYTRFSPRPNARECDSCEKQEERCIAYCNRMGYGPCHPIYNDKNISGGELNRPRLSAAIEALRSGDVLVVDRSDRLARDVGVSIAIEELVEEVGARIEYADGTPSDNSPESKFQRRILMCVSALERDRIRLRTKNGLDRKRKNGEKLGGRVPIGWKRREKGSKQLVRCQEERRAILLACRSKAKLGGSSAQIASELNHIIGPCRGKLWAASTVRKIIQREAYWADPVDGDPALEPTHP